MNCQQFNDSLYDYLDGTLSSEIQQAACDHLRACPDCQRALEQEQAAAQFLNRSLARATAGLCFREVPVPSAQPVGERRSFLEAVRFWFRSHAWSAAAASLAILAVAVFVFRPARQPSVPERAQLNPSAVPGLCVINVPIQITTHSFRQQDNTVVDTLAASVAYARFP
jgi:anti-sigma factor RsiW